MSRIFFLEAMVFKLQLDERIVRDTGGDTVFVVKINLLHLPSLNVSQNGFVDNNCCEENLAYAGQACHFVAKRRDVVKALKRKPLKIGVHRKDEKFPRCYGVVPFSGCVCDLVSKSLEETSCFEFAGTFHLIEPGGNPAGNVAVSIVLTDLGRHVITFYALDRDCFLLKNEPEGCEYKCGTIKDSGSNSSPERKDSITSTALTRDKFMRDTAGISLGAFKLSQGKPEAKGARQSFEDPVVIVDDSKIQEGKASKKKAKKESTKKTK